jgi:PKHD-type hydroxylase
MKKDKKTYHTTVWPFKIDTLHTYAWYKSFLTPGECKKIIDIGSKKKLKKAKTYLGVDANRRDAAVTWLAPTDDLDWLFKRMTDIVSQLNNKYFKFDLYGFIEGGHFIHYKAPKSHHGKHIDIIINRYIRKLSLTIQLSDPNSYKGGDLLLHTDKTPEIAPKEQGTIVAFPSYTLHEIKPITKGERYSLVFWVTGPQFK